MIQDEDDLSSGSDVEELSTSASVSDPTAVRS